MQYLYVLILLVGISEAAQPPVSPVYRSSLAPSGPVKNAPPSPAQQNAPTAQAEERESQVYAPSPEKALGGVQGVNGVQGQPVAGGKPGPGQNGNEQLFQVVYFPGGTHPGQNLQQPQSAGYPMTYQAQQPGTPPASGGSFLSSFTWTDALVAIVAVGLVAVGSVMWFPGVVGLQARAMRKLSELKSEDAARMARSVMQAIQRFSEMNNARNARE
ncbi:unnamed protein product [Allacma fusca]|uniref:Uncharacterized protein n=1 Tax=Allacma fusca TaxID=39272 RepID=A0A8J2K6B2_9HEXA|nr:unnamed protein product [Allacma fusca]